MLGIFGGLEDHGSGPLWPSICTDVDVRPNDVTGGSKEVLQILPTSLVWQLEEASVTVTVWGSIDHVRCRHIIGYQGCYRVVQSGHGGGVEEEGQHATRGQPWPSRSCQELEWHRNGTRFPGPGMVFSKFESTGTQGSEPTSRMKTGRPSKTCSDNSRTERWASS